MGLKIVDPELLSSKNNDNGNDNEIAYYKIKMVRTLLSLIKSTTKSCGNENINNSTLIEYCRWPFFSGSLIHC